MLYSCTHRATLGVPAPSQLEHTDCDCCIIPEPTGLSVTLMPVRRHTLHACPAPALPPWLTTYHKQGYNYLTNSRITIPTKLKLYNTCILPIFPYGSECWAVTKRDVLKIDALDHWCLRKLLGIKWYHHVRNDEVRRTTGQPRLSAIVQARRLSLFGHIARMPDETDARSIITAPLSENWRKPPGRPRTTWMKTIQQDLRSNNHWMRQ